MAIPSLPRDGANTQVPLMPPIVPLKVTYDASVDATTEITLQSGTTLVDITALVQPICVRWGTSDASVATDGYSFIVPAGSSVQRPVPPSITAINFISQTAGAVLSLGEY